MKLKDNLIVIFILFLFCALIIFLLFFFKIIDERTSLQTFSFILFVTLVGIIKNINAHTHKLGEYRDKPIIETPGYEAVDTSDLIKIIYDKIKKIFSK
jgi:hypothetical protein